MPLPAGKFCRLLYRSLTMPPESGRTLPPDLRA
jgi:hypothetical protein